MEKEKVHHQWESLRRQREVVLRGMETLEVALEREARARAMDTAARHTIEVLRQPHNGSNGSDPFPPNYG